MERTSRRILGLCQRFIHFFIALGYQFWPDSFQLYSFIYIYIQFMYFYTRYLIVRITNASRKISQSDVLSKAFRLKEYGIYEYDKKYFKWSMHETKLLFTRFFDRSICFALG